MRHSKFFNGKGIVLTIAVGSITIFLFALKPDKFRDESMILIQGEIIETPGQPTFTVASFLMDRNLVTVAEFDQFVKATGYITEAEQFGEAGVFDPNLQIFTSVKGANYKFPLGTEKGEAASNHPVTQVSWNDAIAYANWRGKRLPTQLEWEFAARNGKNKSDDYAWGNDLAKNGIYNANIWQGNFPFNNSLEDGYAFTSPVGVFGKNSNGLTDMGGNVWQWCSDIVEPLNYEKIFDPAPRRVIKGGSYLCDPMVCQGFKIKNSSSTTPESSMAHIGFRCVKDVK